MKIGEMKSSKFLKKEDFGTQGKNVTIERLDQEDVSMQDQPADMKFVLFFQGFEKGMVLNWTNTQLVAQVTGSEETEDWKGRQLNVYEDPTIAYAGKLIGGLRVRHPLNPVQSENPADGIPEGGDKIPF